MEVVENKYPIVEKSKVTLRIDCDIIDKWYGV